MVDVEPVQGSPKPRSCGLLFHPDFLKGTELASRMHLYSFFSYDTYEGLHASTEEIKLIFDCFDKISYELKRNMDRHSRGLIISQIQIVLDYFLRFYERQFETRGQQNRGIVVMFETLVAEYLRSPKLQQDGPPSVQYCAEALNLSPNYFRDVIKKETGKSALEYIHSEIISLAKHKIFDHVRSISEISYELGFKYPSHFTRFFKQHVGITPDKYRKI